MNEKPNNDEPPAGERGLRVRKASEIERKELPGTKEGYHAMLHGLLKALAIHGGDVHSYRSEESVFMLKMALATWTRSVHDTPEGNLMLADIEHLMKINRIADSLQELWDWSESES